MHINTTGKAVVIELQSKKEIEAMQECLKKSKLAGYKGDDDAYIKYQWVSIASELFDRVVEMAKFRGMR